MVDFMLCDFYHNKTICKRNETHSQGSGQAQSARQHGGERWVRPGATCPEPPAGRTMAWVGGWSPRTTPLPSVSSNWEATTAPHVYAEEEHRLPIGAPRPRGFLAMAPPLLRQPRVNLPGTHPRRDTAAHALPTHSALGVHRSMSEPVIWQAGAPRPQLWPS